MKKQHEFDLNFVKHIRNPRSLVISFLRLITENIYKKMQIRPTKHRRTSSAESTIACSVSRAREGEGGGSGGERERGRGRRPGVAGGRGEGGGGSS